MSDVRVVVAKLLLVGQSDVDADAMWARLEPADREGWLRCADHHLTALRNAGLLADVSPVRRAITDWRARASNAAMTGHDLTAATLRLCANEAESALAGRLALVSADEAAWVWLAEG